MSICPKNKSSKGRRDKRRANWKMTALWLLQQKRNHSAGLIPAVQKRSGSVGSLFCVIGNSVPITQKRSAGMHTSR